MANPGQTDTVLIKCILVPRKFQKYITQLTVLKNSSTKNPEGHQIDSIKSMSRALYRKIYLSIRLRQKSTRTVSLSKMSLYESKLQTLFSIPTVISTTERSPFQSYNTTSFPITTSIVAISESSSSPEQYNTELVYSAISSTEPNKNQNQLPSDIESSTFLPFTNSITTDLPVDTVTELTIFVNSTSPTINETLFNATQNITENTTNIFVTLQAHPYTLDLLLFPLFIISLLSFLINIVSLHLVLNDYNLSIRKHPTNSTIISLSLSNILGIIFLGFVTIIPHKICLLQAFIETFYSSVCLFSLCLISLDRVAVSVLILIKILLCTHIHSP